MSIQPSIRNAFTVDVEDYFHVSAFAATVPTSQWDQYECRVVRNTGRILQVLDERQVRGTFFILGWVAERFPGLVRDIQKGGHEIGCHSYWHRLIYQMNEDEFRNDLVRAKDAIEQITGEPVVAYRAPSFSVTSQSLWALDILRAEGIRIDSSIFPVRHDRYGIPGAPRFLHRIETSSGSLVEFPPSVARILSANVPVGGGGYFRLYPLAFTTACLRRINSAAKQPFMFYVHPWEVDPDQPRLRGPWLRRFRHCVNMSRTEGRLRKLIGKFSFGAVGDVVAERLPRQAHEIRPMELPHSTTKPLEQTPWTAELTANCK